MLLDLIPALILITCSDGHACNPGRDAVYLAQNSISECIEVMQAMPGQPKILGAEQQFAFTASCGMVKADLFED